MTPAFNGVNSLLSLLSRSSSPCLTCGKHGPPSARYPGICARCEALIPWIRDPRCPTCGRHVGCPDCTRSGEVTPIRCNRSAVAYNRDMREWLGQYKYRGNERYAPLLGLMLVRAYQVLKLEQTQTHIIPTSPRRRLSSLFSQGSISSCSWEADAFIPVPVSNSRLVERGFNQAERLANELSRHTGIPVLQLLKRTHHTGKQSFKGRVERMSDMKHAFAPDSMIYEEFSRWLHTAPQLRPVRLIIIDDIYTTGSTIRACAESVRQMTEACGYHADIYSLTWARS